MGILDGLVDCWWCGSDSGYKQVATCPDQGDDVVILCTHCGACGPEADTPEESARLWNAGPDK